MIKTILLFFLAACFFTCKRSAIKNKLSESDSLVITFNVPNSDAVTRTVSAVEKNAIRKVIGFVNGRETEKLKCGHDGNLIFYKDGKEILPVVFKYREKNCEHFLLEVDGKLIHTKMSGEAVDFLHSLELGKTWY